MSSSYDPYVFAYLLACGGKREDYHAFMRQLGFYGQRAARTKPVTRNSPATFDSGRPPWCSGRVHVLAASAYVEHPCASVTALADIAKLVATITDQSLSHTRAERAGLTRRLIHALAKLWGSIFDRWPNSVDIPVEQQRAILTYLDPQARAAAAHKQKLRVRKARATTLEHQHLKYVHQQAQQAFRRAGAKKRTTEQQCLLEAVRLRLAAGNYKRMRMPPLLRARRSAAVLEYRIAREAVRDARLALDTYLIRGSGGTTA